MSDESKLGPYRNWPDDPAAQSDWQWAAHAAEQAKENIRLAKENGCNTLLIASFWAFESDLYSRNAFAESSATSVYVNTEMLLGKATHLFQILSEEDFQLELYGDWAMFKHGQVDAYPRLRRMYAPYMSASCNSLWLDIHPIIIPSEYRPPTDPEFLTAFLHFIASW